MADSKAPTDRLPIIISGPSGVGKGTLIKKLFDIYPETFATTVSHTTRSPRPNEVEGVAYFFVSENEFEALKADDGFVEWARFSGNYYGTSKQTIQAQTARGRVVIMDIDLQGAKSIHADPSLKARYVWVKPPSMAALETRLRARGTEREEDVHWRLERARRELEEAEGSDVCDLAIVNGDVETAFRELVEFIFGREMGD